LLSRRVLGLKARSPADEWDDDDPGEGDNRADQHGLLDELVGDRMQADQEDEEDEHRRDRWAQPVTRKNILELPSSSNHGATVLPSKEVVQPRWARRSEG